MFGDGLACWVEGSRKAAGVDVSLLAHDEVMALAVAAAEVASLAEATVAHAMAELDGRGTTRADCGLPAAAWLSRQLGWSRPRAHRAVRVGRCLRRLDRVDAAVAEGTVTYDHATVIANATTPRVEAGVEAVQDHLLDQVDRCSTFQRWQQYVTRFIDELDQDGAGDRNEVLARNRLRVTPDTDGIGLEGRLVDEHATIVGDAIARMRNELFRRFAHDHKVDPSIAIPNRSTLQALALVEICRRGNAVPFGSSKTAAPDVTVVVRADDPDAAQDTHGMRLQDGTTRMVCCDAAFTAVIVDRLGVPLDVGRAERLATPAQRRALAVRDGGCVFPGCDAPHPWTAAHHVNGFNDGGPTDLINLADLCPNHHGLVHSNGWQMHSTGDGWFSFITPTRRSFWSQRHGRQRAGPTPHDDPDWRSKATDPKPP